MSTPEYNSLQWIEIIQHLYKKRISIAMVVAIVSAGAVAGSLLMDDLYKSSANLLPNKNRSVGFELFTEKGGLQSLASSVLGGESEENNRFYVLLESYSTKKNVVEKFNLIDVYETGSSETPLLSAIEILEENTTFEGKEEGNFIIEVWDTSPERARNMADYYVELLNSFNTEISTREAREFRKFIERRYNESIHDLDSLRRVLAEFQSEHGVFELPEQVKQYFSLISGLTAKKYETSIQLNMLERSVQPGNDSYRQARQQLEVLDEKLNEIYSDSDNQNLVLNFKQLPGIGSTYFNLMKEIEIQTEIQKFIVPMYEQARMQEAKALPIVTTVDAPHIPPKKDYPRRSVICILAFLSAIILSACFYIIQLHWMKNRPFYRNIFTPE